MRKSLLLTVYSLLAILLTSCSSLSVYTSTFKDASVLPNGFHANSSFYVASAEDQYSLEHQELKEKIQVLLLSSGYRISEKSNADYHLNFKTITRQESRKISNIKYIPGLPSFKFGEMFTGNNAMRYQERQISTGSFVYVPTEITLFTYKLTVQVHSAKGSAARPIWKGSAITVQENKSLRSSLNYLLASAFKHFGKNTGTEIIENVTSSNSKVKVLEKAIK
ncbi:hypothetical protein CLAVI_000843 [Candidatus Clavichlamydia salmonicola]|uniref:DUF4136 domain-containing protein n=1 Tax=Candidatus Clavichlamydia salmonicola TaxID=469812 RepID=UPI0018910797|nr:DUF4136 domain-containing protein [Candidatus Clavichlamydia salmonicola]MBF5051205.1 hypothetical protein [Candidatus Clavichlamydia salmonicola]